MKAAKKMMIKPIMRMDISIINPSFVATITNYFLYVKVII
jgi:hypothetical protein